MGSEPGRRGQGSLELITGCMFSGKSEALIARLDQANQKGRKTLAFKHSSDNRYDHRDIISHSGGKLPAVAVPDASRIGELAVDADFVAIDEAQFFGADLVEVCRDLVEQGKHVVAAGLDLDSWGLPFGQTADLARIADQVTRLHAVCARCGRPADHTQRLAPVAGQRMVGGAGYYEPRCEVCFQAPPIELRC